jgi:hypothetical protein
MGRDLAADFGEGTTSAKVSIEIIQGSGSIGTKLRDVFIEEPSISLHPFLEESPRFVELTHEDTQQDAELSLFNVVCDPGWWLILPYRHSD